METKFDVKAVIFDLGRVLIGVDLTRGLFSHLQDRKNKNDVLLMEELFGNELFIRFSSGLISPTKFYEAFCKRLNLKFSYDEFVHEWCDIFYELDGMESLFYELREKYPIGILSDIDPLHWRKVLEILPFLKKVDQPVLSFEQGIMKPHPDIYIKASENLNVPIQNCLFIDDRAINVEGAKKTGMQSVQYISTDQIKIHLKNRNIL